MIRVKTIKFIQNCVDSPYDPLMLKSSIQLSLYTKILHYNRTNNPGAYWGIPTPLG